MKTFIEAIEEEAYKTAEKQCRDFFGKEGGYVISEDLIATKMEELYIDMAKRLFGERGWSR